MAPVLEWLRSSFNADIKVSAQLIHADLFDHDCADWYDHDCAVGPVSQHNVRYIQLCGTSTAYFANAMLKPLIQQSKRVAVLMRQLLHILLCNTVHNLHLHCTALSCIAALPQLQYNIINQSVYFVGLETHTVRATSAAVHTAVNTQTPTQ